MSFRMLARLGVAGAVALVGLSAPSVAHASPAPTNGKIVFVRWTSQPAGDERGAVYTVNPDGSDLTRVTPDDGADYAGPALSTDGSTLLYTRAVTGLTSLVAVNLLTGATHQVVPPTTATLGGAALAPDGTHVAFARGGAVFVVGADGAGEVRLSSAGSTASDPVWSPDGTRIAFVQDRGIDISNPDGSGLTAMPAVTPDATWDPAARFQHTGAPTWSPDSTALAFVSSASLWRVQADGSGLVRLARASGPPGAWAAGAKWGPHDQIAFDDNSGITRETDKVRLLSATPSPSGPVTNAPVVTSGSLGGWSPDGKQLLFENLVAYGTAPQAQGDVSVVNIDGTGAADLTNDPSGETPVAWGEGALQTPVAVVQADVSTGLGDTHVALSAIGGTAPYTWTATGLPVGLTISSAGVVSGTTTGQGTSSVSATVTDAAGASASGSFSWTVTKPRLQITWPTGARPAGVPVWVYAGEPVPYRMTATGGTAPYTWTADALPPGLSLSPDGTLTGMPTQFGQTFGYVTVTDADGTATKVWQDWEVGDGLTTGVDPDLYKQYDSTVGESAGLEFIPSGGYSENGLTISVDGAPPGITATYREEFGNNVAYVEGVPTQPGTYTVTVSASDGVVTRTTSFPWVVHPAAAPAPAPVLSWPTGGLDLFQGEPVSANLTAVGGSGPYTWSVSGLPAGVSVAADGAITGTPQQPGTSTVEITVTGADGGTATTEQSWQVFPGIALAAIGSQVSTVRDRVTLASAVASGGLAIPGSAKGYTYWATGLPTGVKLTSDGAFTGAPTKAGHYSVTVWAMDYLGVRSWTWFTWTVKPAHGHVSAAGRKRAHHTDGRMHARGR